MQAGVLVTAPCSASEAAIDAQLLQSDRPLSPTPTGTPPQRGPYLKLSETGSKRPRSTVLLPGSAIKWVHSLVDYYITECSAG